VVDGKRSVKPRDHIGPFRLIREIASGGQATVYLARDPRLSRTVAVKVLSVRAGVDRQRFRREATVASRLDDPGICAVHDFGADHESLYIAMRYVEGETLARHIVTAGPPRRPDALDQAVRLVEQVARAAHKAHEAGIVHRDLKPGNIMVTPAGHPVILDFGLAHDESSPVSLSLSGQVFGTPVYMAPEQIRGEPGQTDRRTDVYALGAILYECVTGHPPFEAPTREQLYRAILANEPPDPRRANPTIPLDLKAVLERALARDMTDRYQTALDLAEDLRRIRTHEPTRARPSGAALRLHRWARRNPTLAAALLVLAVALTVALAGTSWLLGQRRAVLAESVRGYDMQSAPALIKAEAEDNWPATPQGIGPMDAWLAEAESHHSRLETHRAYLKSLRGEQLTRIDLARIGGLVRDLERLGVLIESVRTRRQDAAQITQRTIDDYADSWNSTIDSIADERKSPAYAGLRIVPQVGLVPLGPDPDSQLFEFAHVQSGAMPRREPDTGKLVLAEETGFVFVLIPPGAFDMGADPPSEGRPEGSPNVDPIATAVTQPVHRVTLEAFFLSKYEATHAQWLRLTGTTGSHTTLIYDYRFGPIYSLLWPADGVARATGHSVLARLGLSLPTEAQWEYAARAGTTTVWWTGDDVGSLEGAARFIPLFATTKDELGTPWPVGSYRANPFGLHDVHGNTKEWTRDSYGSYEIPVRPGDGLRLVEDAIESVARDGGGSKTPRWSASAARSIQNESGTAGIRPARAINSSSPAMPGGR